MLQHMEGIPSWLAAPGFPQVRESFSSCCPSYWALGGVVSQWWSPLSSYRFQIKPIILQSVLHVNMQQELYLHRELELVVEFWHQQVMAESLPHLHDPHHCSIYLVLPVLEDPLCGAHLLLHLRGTYKAQESLGIKASRTFQMYNITPHLRNDTWRGMLL